MHKPPQGGTAALSGHGSKTAMASSVGTADQMLSRAGYLERMAGPGPPDPADVPIGLMVSKADAAQIDQVLARPEFAGWTRAEWCREIIRSALRYYTRDAFEPGPGQAGASGRPAAGEPSPAEPEPPAQPGCSHPADARDYETGTCAACGAILWD
jgi:hypothetical protein